jgi:hypothetical protein
MSKQPYSSAIQAKRARDGSKGILSAALRQAFPIAAKHPFYSIPRV